MDKDSLDGKDLKIITALRKNGRASIREISKATGIRPSTVHQRIKRMVGSGVIERFTVKLNDDRIGEGFTVFMLISGSTERYLDDKILGSKHVKGVYGVTGEYDLLLKMKFQGRKSLKAFMP